MIFDATKQELLLELAALAEHQLLLNYQLKQAKRNVRNAVYYNTMTGLPNKRLFEEKLNTAIYQANNKELIVAAIKLCRIALFEELHGTENLLQIMLEVNNRIMKKIKSDFTIAEWNKDAFVIFFRSAQQEGSLHERLIAWAKFYHNLIITII